MLALTIGLAISVLLEAGFGLFGVPVPLQYLGPVGRILLGVPRESPAATWGGMLEDGLEAGVQAPWLPIFPLAGLVLVAVGLVLLGSGIVDLLKQRARTS
jgi:ABC-type dipeptide/oligopeptide/nickel transport system permease subunit